MTTSELIRTRLGNQQLLKPAFKKAGALVKWMGAVQAQDFFGSLWAIGERLIEGGEQEVEGAIADRTIIRTWPMRGTLHFVAPEDVRWMLKLLTPRIISSSAGIYKECGLDIKTFLKSRKLFEAALCGGHQLTRDEMYAVLKHGKISPGGNQRGLHIIGHLAQEGVICLGPRRGKQQTFTLLDEWVPAAKVLLKDEALAELSARYFESHGPATIHDFRWWSGLSMVDAGRGLEMIKSGLDSFQEGSHTYWMKELKNKYPSDSKTVFVIPAYDEYLVGYKDRSAALHPKFRPASPRNAIFTSCILMDGKVVGTWFREFTKSGVAINLKPFATLPKMVMKAIHTQEVRYAKFVGMTLSD